MFEVGKTYEFHMNIGGHRENWHGTVEAYDHPLLKTADHTIKPPFGQGDVIKGQIINVTSASFVSAQETSG